MMSMPLVAAARENRLTMPPALRKWVLDRADDVGA